MKDLKINHLAVLVAVVLQFVLGFIWYGPLFGEPWMGMVGLDMATLEANPSAGPWITNIFSSFAGVYLLAWLFTKMGTDSLGKGAAMGFLIGFVFVLLAEMTGGMFAMEPYGLAWITGGFTTVALTVSGAVLGAWTKSK
jgi:hypothetical protein